MTLNMKVKELIERVGAEEIPTGRVIAYIKDGLEEINTISETHVTTEKIDITKDQRFYDLPNDVIKVLEVRCKNHLNSKDEYRQVPRLIYDPRIKDADGV
ncbi:MAG: hypothetical protein Unbinned1966contig1000_48 [Prokaryotic dsDNA virus sp.]|nr:MAG: hypothetical protein Unbinned1966contig1000_48 [Prokaryotic dsDNA virus sp.]